MGRWGAPTSFPRCATSSRAASRSLDLRGADDAARHEAVGRLRDEAHSIATRRSVTVAWDDTGDVPAVAMDERLTAAFSVDVRLPAPGTTPR